MYPEQLYLSKNQAIEKYRARHIEMSFPWRICNLVFILPLVTGCSELDTPITQAGVSFKNHGQMGKITKASQSYQPIGKQLITPQQIGKAQLGMSVGELKQLYPQANYRLTSLPGIPRAIAVSEKSEDLFYFIASPDSGGLPRDEAVIMFVTTNNPKYKTVEGIKPGISLEKATKAYGPVLLYFSPQAEYAQFQNQPSNPRSGMGFWAKAAAGQKAAGVYQWSNTQQNSCETGNSGFCQSNQFNPGSTIWYISVGSQR